LRPAVAPPENASGRTLRFVLRDRDVLLMSDPLRVPEGGPDVVPGIGPGGWLYIGQLGEKHCFAAEMPASFRPAAGFEIRPLREIYGLLDEGTFHAAGCAAQIIDWDRDHRFCGHCGRATTRRSNERARECPACGRLFFPRLAPAVIVLVRRDDEILLARAHRLPPGVFSLVAGFVEPGESLEQAAMREVREEVGVAIRNLSYFASQPWPFPHSLMAGFTADYAGGEIRIDPAEIAEAGWFRWDRMPRIPGPLSLSHRLIAAYLAEHGVSP